MIRLTLGLVAVFLVVPDASAQTFSNEFSRLNTNPISDRRIENVSVADFNADGRLDIYHTGRLYRQNEDGSFDDVLARAGIQVEGSSVQGGIFGDANQDGLLDLLILDAEPGSRFYLNRSGEKFDLGNSKTNLIFQQPPVGAFWADVNEDNFVDLVAGSSNGQNPVFLGNTSNSFTNVGDLMLAGTEPVTCGLAVSDFDQDQDPDFFAARCGAGNELLVNNSSRDRFSTNFRGSGVESRRVSQDGHWFDYNNDGWEDLLVVNHWAEFNNAETHLYRNDAGQNFVDVAAEAGVIGAVNLPKGPATIGDFNNDGWQDIYLPFNNQGRLYRNMGDGTFEDIFDISMGLDSVGTAVAAGDINNDGWLDLVIPQAQGTAIMINDGGTNNWASIELKNPSRNRLGVGSRIHIQAGGMHQMRTITAGTGAGSQSDGLRAHFGLGTASTIDEVLIVWPDGFSETITNLPANERYTYVRGVGLNDAPQAFALGAPVNAGFVNPDADTITFEWAEAVDTDAVTYTLTITGRGLKLSFPDLTSNSLDVSTALMPPNQIYEWSVVASDGYSLRSGSEERSFSFGQPDVANSTLQLPALYDFGLPNISSGVAEFADIDLDGDLDLLVGGDATGTAVLRLYRADDATVVADANGGEFIFKALNPAGVSLEPVSQPNIAWGDIDRDGDPDLLVTGISREDGQPLTTVYQNLVGQFIPLSVDGLENVWGSGVSLQDINGDGWPDIVLAGSSETDATLSTMADVWISQNGSGFVRASAGIPPHMFGESAFADMDGDGDLDMALTGDLGGGRFHAGIYRNDGVGSGGTFTLISSPLAQVSGGSVTWGDVDADGDPDVLLSGGAFSPELLRGITRLYVNDGGSFSTHPFPFDGVVTGRAIWGDYENDGDQDIFVVGARSPLGETVGRLYRNVDGQFVAELDVKGFVFATAAFGDYNGDGDLDFIAFGIDAEGNVDTTFYINQQVPEPVPVTR